MSIESHRENNGSESWTSIRFPTLNIVAIELHDGVTITKPIVWVIGSSIGFCFFPITRNPQANRCPSAIMCGRFIDGLFFSLFPSLCVEKINS